jgi:uncharacterized iron-regulated membrane protein
LNWRAVGVAVWFLSRGFIMSSIDLPQQDAVASTRLYRAVWRWHFYAGLYVIPFLMVLAVTGFFMMLFTTYLPEYGDRLSVTPQAQMLEPTAIAEAARASLGAEATLKEFRTPYDNATPALVKVAVGEAAFIVAVDPYTGSILRMTGEEDTWNLWLEKIHGTLLLGDTGDRMLEIAASLGVIMAVTGVFMWWPRVSGFFSALVPKFGVSGRSLWKSLHETTGAWMAVILLFFTITGLAWSGIWGSKFTQAWSTFPAAKWDNVPLSDKTMESLNGNGRKQVPWAMEQTPLPESGSASGIAILPSGTELNLSNMVVLGRKIGIEGRFRVSIPEDEKGVWTLSQNSMSYDSTSPTIDRTTHVDQFTGKVLADVRYSDYALPAKAMAVGIALHEGQLGWWNFAINTVFCLSIVFLCVSGVVMWFKRRPVGKLGAPLYPREYSVPKSALGLGAILAAAFPLGGIAIALFAIIDFLLPKRFKEVGSQSH